MVAVGWPWWDGSLVCEEEEQGEREGAEEEEEHDNKEYNRDRQTGGEEGRRGEGEGGVWDDSQTRKSTASWVGGEC